MCLQVPVKSLSVLLLVQEVLHLQTVISVQMLFEQAEKNQVLYSLGLNVSYSLFSKFMPPFLFLFFLFLIDYNRFLCSSTPKSLLLPNFISGQLSLAHRYSCKGALKRLTEALAKKVGRNS